MMTNSELCKIVRHRPGDRMTSEIQLSGSLEVICRGGHHRVQQPLLSNYAQRCQQSGGAFSVGVDAGVGDGVILWLIDFNWLM